MIHRETDEGEREICIRPVDRLAEGGRGTADWENGALRALKGQRQTQGWETDLICTETERGKVRDVSAAGRQRQSNRRENRNWELRDSSGNKWRTWDSFFFFFF